MARWHIPGGDARRVLWRDLWTGRAGWAVRLGLSLASAAGILAVAMLFLGLLEVGGRRAQDEHIALALGTSGATWCVMLAALWWTFRRFQVALKAIFAVIATWMLAVPSAVFLEATFRTGEEYLIAFVILLAIGVSLGSIILICYHAHRSAKPTHAIVRVRMACPECGYSMQGLSDCRCPECGTEYTIDSLVEALGAGQVVTDVTARPAPETRLEPPPTPGALPGPEPG